jgi:hypothetical protein
MRKKKAKAKIVKAVLSGPVRMCGLVDYPDYCLRMRGRERKWRVVDIRTGRVVRAPWLDEPSSRGSKKR